MIRPALTLLLWFAIAALVIVNDIIGDTWIAVALSGSAVGWYKTLVPLPYVALMAAIHARRTAGPQWREAAWFAALLWPPSTVLAEFLYERLTFDQAPAAFLDRYAFWWGQPYTLLVIALFAAPLVAGTLVARNR
jgi:hypothetical protein